MGVARMPTNCYNVAITTENAYPESISAIQYTIVGQNDLDYF